jgi:hypothetical protein
MSRGESHASVHRQAVRESLRDELNRELNKIYEATYVMVWDGKTIYCYGSRPECEKFADGLGRRASVRPITDKDHAQLAKDKRQAYRNP